jgi:hypothetical protein
MYMYVNHIIYSLKVSVIIVDWSSARKLMVFTIAGVYIYPVDNIQLIIACKRVFIGQSKMQRSSG